MDKQLEKSYFDPKEPSSFSGIDKVWRTLKTKEQFKNIKRKDVKKWLEKQDTYTLHRPVPKVIQRNKVKVGFIDDLWDTDLLNAENLSKYNKNIKFLLIVIDIFSRYLWVRPLKNKTNDEVIKGFKSIFSEGRLPVNLRSDKGSEYTGKPIQKFFKEKDINHFTTNNETKANYAERVIRTLKSKLYKYFTQNQTYKYIDKLQDFVDSYNNTKHRSIQAKPSEVSANNEDKIWKLLYVPKKTKKISKSNTSLKTGDLVRISFTRGVFDRGYNQKWSEELFKIVKRLDRQKPVYILKDLQDRDIKGTFYPREIQKVDKKDNSLYKIEKILGKRKRKGRTQYLVRWLGYGKDFDSYVDAKDIKDIDNAK